MAQTKTPPEEQAAENRIFNDPVLQRNAIEYFTEMTAKDSPLLHRMMGDELASRVSPEDFSAFCHSFAEGVSYIRDKYHVQPIAINIVDEPHHGVYTNLDTNIINISLGFIEKMVTGSTWHTQHKTNPFLLSTPDMAMMYGVEEAFHVYQNIQNPDRVRQHVIAQTTLHDTIDGKIYDAQPMEYEAMQEVHQAMIDNGIIQRSPLLPTGINVEDAKWAMPYLQQNTIPSCEKFSTNWRDRVALAPSTTVVIKL